MGAEQPLQMREALLPLVGHAGYQQVLTVMYSKDLLQAVGVSAAMMRQIDTQVATHGVVALQRDERILESDSKSRIYVVHMQLDDRSHCSMVVKWYGGKRQRLAVIEQQMNAYFCQRLAPHCAVGPVLAVVPLAATAALSVAILPYLGNTTLYDHLHRIPRHAPQVEALLHQAGDTLATIQVLGRLGHEEGAIYLAPLAPEEATAYFVHQIDSVLLHAFAAGGQPLPMATALLEHFTFFASVLGADSCAAGLYYRGINPRNIMWVEGEQVEIDFEQETLRSRFIDIVSLLENGLEMTHWDEAVDYPPFAARVSFAAWEQKRQQAWATLARHNYLTHHQVETLTQAFIDTTLRLERQYLAPPWSSYSRAERRLLWETTRLFRHLQYVGYCKRNEQQALTESKRISSRYRQQFHALWAKCALDNLLFPSRPEDDCLPAAGRPAAMALRQTLETLPLGPKR